MADTLTGILSQINKQDMQAFNALTPKQKANSVHNSFLQYYSFMKKAGR